MTAAASLRDSPSVLEADLGKGRVIPQVKDLPVYPSRCIPPQKKKAGGRAALKTSCASRMRFTTPRHFRTAQRGGYASGICAAGVAFVAEAISVSGKWPCQPCAVWIRTKGAFGAPCGTPSTNGTFHIPLEPSTTPWMVCSGTASVLAIPSLPHILVDMVEFQAANAGLW